MCDWAILEGDIAGRCGGCGSGNMMTSSDGKLAVCLACHRLQEPETRDWPEAKMCDNCAFRKGSPERADPWRWMKIEETHEDGAIFYCHKGLHAKFEKDGGTVTFSAPKPGTERMTVCAGWLAANIAYHQKRQANA